MARSSFGSGLDDDDDINSGIKETLAEQSPADLGLAPADIPRPPASKSLAGENREPFAWSFANQVGGLPLELGAHAKATLVDHEDVEWLIALDQSGPVGVVAHHTAPFIAAAAAGTAHGHPAAYKPRLRQLEPLHPH